MASPTAGGGGAGPVCCMCGDHGLPHELFRCKSCRVRQQHRYCSDRYPRAATYRRCNWCLKKELTAEGGDAHAAGSSKLTEKRKSSSSAAAAASPGTSTATSDVEDRQRHGARGSITTTALGRPVKKQKTDVAQRVPPAKEDGGSKKLREAGKMVAQPVRVKVRRYKLLAEVISC